MTVETGKLRLLESMTFLSLGLGESKVTISDQNERLTFILDFLNDKNQDANGVFSFQLVDSHTGRLSLINWNNPLGATFPQPLEVGTINGKKLFLLLFVKKAGQKGEIREVLFTSYVSAEAGDAH